MSKIPPIHCLNAILQESFEKTKPLEKSLLKDFSIQGTKAPTWITIHNPSVARVILASLGDDDKKNILNAVLDESKTFMKILEITGLPPSSTYRKICTLVDNGLIIDLNPDNTTDGKRKIKYKAIFQNIEINIEKGKIIIKILLTKESIEKSTTLQIIRC